MPPPSKIPMEPSRSIVDKLEVGKLYHHQRMFEHSYKVVLITKLKLYSTLDQTRSFYRVTYLDPEGRLQEGNVACVGASKHFIPIKVGNKKSHKPPDKLQFNFK